MLGLVVLGCMLYAAVVFVGVIALWPWGLPVLLVLSVIGYVFFRIVYERLANAEDDNYDNKVDN